ncbi:putative proteoglycan 4, partial [Apostichopus japonicus]
MMPCPPGIGPFDAPAMFGNDPVRFEQPPFGMGLENMMNMNNAPGPGNFMMPGPFGPQGPPGPQWPLDFPGEMPAMGPFMDGPQMMGPRFPFPNRPTDFRNDQVQGMKRKVTGNQQKSNRAKQRKRSNSESKTQTKPTKEVKKVTPVLDYNAESLKLMDQIARGSKPHQLALIKKIGINEKFENRDLLPWMCYLCDQENDTWQEYVNHCKSTKHKSQAIGLGTTLKKEEKARVHNAFKKLPFTGVSFSIGRTQAGDKPLEDKTQSLPHLESSLNHETFSPVGEGYLDPVDFFPGHKIQHWRVTKERSAGLQECKPCGRFFMLKDRLQNHLKSEGHQKRETFLKQRYGNSWLEYYWYNQSKPRERGDAEPMGVAFVLPVSGYFCKLCSKFYNSEITAKDVHCRSDSHIEKVKEWDREQLTKKDSVSMKVKQSDIEAAVKETDQQRKNTRWQPAKITLDTSTIFLVDSDEEESQEYDGKQVTTDRQSEKKGREDKKSTGGTEREEDLEEGEL